jgi:hypothetical protein
VLSGGAPTFMNCNDKAFLMEKIGPRATGIICGLEQQIMELREYLKVIRVSGTSGSRLETNPVYEQKRDENKG